MKVGDGFRLVAALVHIAPASRQPQGGCTVDSEELVKPTWKHLGKPLRGFLAMSL